MSPLLVSYLQPFCNSVSNPFTSLYLYFCHSRPRHIIPCRWSHGLLTGFPAFILASKQLSEGSSLKSVMFFHSLAQNPSVISLIIRPKVQIITKACVLQCYLTSQISLGILPPPYAPVFLLLKHAKLWLCGLSVHSTFNIFFSSFRS